MGMAAVGPAQEAAGSMALARAPLPRVSQPSVGQVRSAGVRTARLTASLVEAKARRWAAAEPTSAALAPVSAVSAARAWMSAQVRLSVPRTTTGSGRED